MIKPKALELKQWLVEHTIVGLEVQFRQTSSDKADTWWLMTASDGSQKRYLAGTVRPLVSLEPDHNSVMNVTCEVWDEVDDWLTYADQNANELREYERLRAKFEGKTDD